MDATDIKVGDIVTWTYIPKKTTKDIDDSPEYVRLRNVGMLGKGPFTILDIKPHEIHGDRIILAKVANEKGKEIYINKLALKVKDKK